MAVNGSYDRRVNPGGMGLEDLMKILQDDPRALQLLQQQQQQSNDQGGSSTNMNQIQDIMDRIQGQGGGSAGTGIPITGQELNGMTVHWGPNTASGLGAEGGGSGFSDMLGSGGGEGLGSTLGYIAAAIAAQLAASNNTDTEFEGQKTGNVFTGIGDGGWNPSFSTEPWLAWGHDVLGWDPTVGEKFDAAANNSDWSTALKRLPAAADYWADPIRSWLGYDTWTNIGESIFGDDSDMSKILGFISDPIQGILQKIEDWF